MRKVLVFSPFYFTRVLSESNVVNILIAFSRSAVQLNACDCLPECKRTVVDNAACDVS